MHFYIVRGGSGASSRFPFFDPWLLVLARPALLLAAGGKRPADAARRGGQRSASSS